MLRWICRACNLYRDCSVSKETGFSCLFFMQKTRRRYTGRKTARPRQVQWGGGPMQPPDEIVYPCQLRHKVCRQYGAWPGANNRRFCRNNAGRRKNFYVRKTAIGETGRKGISHRDRVIACPRKDKQICRKSFGRVVKFKSTTRQSGRILSK